MEQRKCCSLCSILQITIDKNALDSMRPQDISPFTIATECSAFFVLSSSQQGQCFILYHSFVLVERKGSSFSNSNLDVKITSFLHSFFRQHMTTVFLHYFVKTNNITKYPLENWLFKSDNNPFMLAIFHQYYYKDTISLEFNMCINETGFFWLAHTDNAYPSLKGKH